MIKKRIVSAFLAITMIFGVGFASSSGAYAEGEGDPIEISTADDLYGALYWGGNYVLTANINTSDSQYGSSLFALTSDTTLDLSDYTVNLAGGASVYTYGSNLTIKGNTGKIIQATASDYPTIWAYMGDIALDGGNIEGESYAVRVSEGNKFTMNGGTITGEFGVVGHGASEVVVNGGEMNTTTFSISGYGLETGAKFTVTGGILNSDEYAIYMPHIDGVLEVSGGEITGAAGAIALNRGTATITGGTLKSLGTATLPGDAASGDGVKGYSNAVVGIAKEYDDVTLTVSGGEFIAEGNAGLIVDPSGLDTEYTADVTISGGKFSELPVLAQVADGFDVYDTGVDGPYFVEPVTTVTLPEDLLLEVGDTYEVALSDIAKKYGTFAYDSSVVSVSDDGMITAVATDKGSVVNFNLHNYKAPVDDNFKVTVWKIEPSADDGAENATDSKNIADFFAERIKAALSGDEEFIYNENVLLFINDIRNALVNGEKVVSSLNTYAVSEEDFKELGEGYAEIMAALKDGEKAIAFFNSEVDLTNEDGSDYFGWGFKLKTPITQRFTIPESYADEEGAFAILRSHLNQSTGKIEVSRLETTRDGDDLLTENDQFSTFVIAYTTPAPDPSDDTDDATDSNTSADAPETGTITREGGSAIVATLFTSIFVGIAVAVLTFVKLINSRWVRGE